MAIIQLFSPFSSVGQLTTFWKYFMVIFQPSFFSSNTSYASRGNIPHSE